MSKEKDNFIRLQAHWYEVLREEGFRDIEHVRGVNLVLIESASKRFSHIDEFVRTANEEYYRYLTHMVNDESTFFRNDADRLILLRHADGIKIKCIVQELERLGVSKDRYSVRIIIRRYEKAWKIKMYSRKELHLKK